MSPSKVEIFKDFLSKSFGEGVYSRELRLSSEELEYVREKYPHASLKKCLGEVIDNGKIWYEVNLTGSTGTTTPWLPTDELVAIQQENLRLKVELETLKKTMKFV